MSFFSENQNHEPMHSGEVFGIWTYILTAKSTVALYQVYESHAGDKELQTMIDVSMRQIRGEIEELERLLLMNQTALPPAPAERPETPVSSIPAGAKLTDPEISALVLKDINEGLIACSVMILQSVREDIADFFTRLHRDKAQFRAKYLRLSRDKGWFIPPPVHPP